MATSLPDFSGFDYSGPPSDVAYTGLTDTTLDFSGASTFDTVGLGSPLQLDTSLGLSTASTPDFIGPMPDPAADAQMLSGISDPPFASAYQSTPFPNSSPTSSIAANAFSALGKFGASFATLFGNHPVAIQPVSRPNPLSMMSAQKPANGTNLVILLIVVGALVILIAHGGGE